MYNLKTASLLHALSLEIHDAVYFGSLLWKVEMCPSAMIEVYFRVRQDPHLGNPSGLS